MKKKKFNFLMTSVKKALYLSVFVFSSKVLIEETIFSSPSGDGNAILRGHPSPQISTLISQLHHDPEF